MSRNYLGESEMRDYFSLFDTKGDGKIAKVHQFYGLCKNIMFLDDHLMFQEKKHDLKYTKSKDSLLLCKLNSLWRFPP